MASPNNPSNSTRLNLTLAVPNALPGKQEFAETVVGHYPVFSAKSWLSLNWFRVCNQGCGYCYRPGRGSESAHSPEKIYDEKFVADYLMDHPYFVPQYNGKTSSFPPSVIGLHTSSTEAFAPEVKDSTFRMLQLLDQKGINNPVAIVTKLFLKKEEIEYLRQNLHNISLYIMICYSAMPQEIEPMSDPETVENKARFMQALKDSGFTPVHYFRPIAFGWNDSPDRIGRALAFGSGSSAIVVGGITLSDDEFRQLDQLEIPLPGGPPEGWAKYGYRRKWFPKEAEETVIGLKDAAHIDTPLFRRASCSISYLRGMPDYNGYRFETKDNCTRSCPLVQVARCESIKPPTPERVKEALDKMQISGRSFEITPSGVIVEPEEMQFHILDTFELRHLLGFPVYLKKVV